MWCTWFLVGILFHQSCGVTINSDLFGSLSLNIPNGENLTLLSYPVSRSISNVVTGICKNWPKIHFRRCLTLLSLSIHAQKASTINAMYIEMYWDHLMKIGAEQFQSSPALPGAAGTNSSGLIFSLSLGMEWVSWSALEHELSLQEHFSNALHDAHSIPNADENINKLEHKLLQDQYSNDAAVSFQQIPTKIKEKRGATTKRQKRKKIFDKSASGQKLENRLFLKACIIGDFSAHEMIAIFTSLHVSEVLLVVNQHDLIQVELAVQSISLLLTKYSLRSFENLGNFYRKINVIEENSFLASLVVSEFLANSTFTSESFSVSEVEADKLSCDVVYFKKGNSEFVRRVLTLVHKFRLARKLFSRKISSLNSSLPSVLLNDRVAVLRDRVIPISSEHAFNRRSCRDDCISERQTASSCVCSASDAKDSFSSVQHFNSAAGHGIIFGSETLTSRRDKMERLSRVLDSEKHSDGETNEVIGGGKLTWVATALAPCRSDFDNNFDFQGFSVVSYSPYPFSCLVDLHVGFSEYSLFPTQSSVSTSALIGGRGPKEVPNTPTSFHILRRF